MYDNNSIKEWGRNRTIWMQKNTRKLKCSNAKYLCKQNKEVMDEKRIKMTEDIQKTNSSMVDTNLPYQY